VNPVNFIYLSIFVRRQYASIPSRSFCKSRQPVLKKDESRDGILIRIHEFQQCRLFRPCEREGLRRIWQHLVSPVDCNDDDNDKLKRML